MYYGSDIENKYFNTDTLITSYVNLFVYFINVSP